MKNLYLSLSLTILALGTAIAGSAQARPQSDTPDRAHVTSKAAQKAIGATKHVSLQTASPLRLKSMRSTAQMMPKVRWHQDSDANDELRGGGIPNDLCANAQVLTVNAPGVCPGGAVAGNNGGAGNDEGFPACDVTDTAFEDVWYAFNAGTSSSITIDVAPGTIEDLIVEVLEGGCGGTSIHCDFSEVSYTVAVTPGMDYVIRIGSNNDFGVGGTFDICLTGTEGGATPPNDDCTGAVAQDLTVGSTISFSGDNTGATEDGGTGFVMVWEAFTTTECADVTINYCVAGSEFTNFLINLAVQCPDFITGVLTGASDACTVSFTDLAAGTYYIPVMVDPADTPIGPYTIEVSATACGGGPTPPNDDCAGAVAQDLTVGSTLSFSGDNTGATEDGGTGFVMVWEAFTTTECADVTINYCVAGSEFTNFLVNLAVQCPDFITGVLTGASDACTVTFTDLAAGTYYIPVMVDPADTPIGPYTIEVSATACGPVGPYCEAGADGMPVDDLDLEERIINVTFSTIDNDSPDEIPIAPAYQDFTAVPAAEVVAGQTYPIAVDVAREGANTSWSENQVIAWIDFNQDQDFDDAGELVFTSEIGSVDIYSGDVAIPLTAAIGTTRMRIRLHDTHDGSQYDNNFNDTPCGIASFGEVEDYTVDVIGVITAVAEEAAPTFSLFPNPTDGNLELVNGMKDALTVIDVLDMTGRLVYSEQRQLARGQRVHLPLAGTLAAGTYALRLSSEHGRAEQRFVVR